MAVGFKGGVKEIYGELKVKSLDFWFAGYQRSRATCRGL
jgi:hypothetical protein